MISLRPYQSTLVEHAWANLCAKQSTVLVAPTGAGKTVIFGALTKRAAEQGARVTILAHRHELIEQISRTLTAFDVEHGVISPSAPNHSRRAVQVASVQTLVRRLANYAAPDVVIADECSHAIPASTFGKILTTYSKAARLGVTATPERLSGEGLHDLFGTMIMGPTVRDLIEQGSLCPYRLYAPPVNYMDSVHRRMGDFDKKELAEAADRPTITGNAVAHYRKLTDGKRALVFCVSRKHAENVATEFRLAGYRAMSIDGALSAKDRAHRIAGFTDGSIQVLTSCDLISEGFDCPAIEVAILLRPTQSLALFLQQVGRSLRTFTGKECAIILDHAGNTMRHGFPDDEREWSLQGKQKKKKGASEESVNVKTCGQCFLAVRELVRVCPHCGYIFKVVSREIAEVVGELVEVDREALRLERIKEQAATHSPHELEALGRQRGYKPGWGEHVWNARMKAQRIRYKPGFRWEEAWVAKIRNERLSGLLQGSNEWKLALEGLYVEADKAWKVFNAEGAATAEAEAAKSGEKYEI